MRCFYPVNFQYSVIHNKKTNKKIMCCSQYLDNKFAIISKMSKTSDFVPQISLSKFSLVTPPPPTANNIMFEYCKSYNCKYHTTKIQQAYMDAGNKRQKIQKGLSKMDNAKNLVIQGTQKKTKTKKHNTTKYVLDATIRKQTRVQIT